MAEARTGCIAIIRWIWTQVKCPFSYMVHDSPDSQVTQVLVDVDASAISPGFRAVMESNQEETLVCVPDATSGPSICNLETISKPIQLDNNPSSSSCIPSTSTGSRRCKYDVFLSFRGADTRKGITVDIRDRLQSRGIKTFMDDQGLQVGDLISPTLMEAIEISRFAVVVLSPRYADSPWCLEELVKICECMGNDSNEKRIFPIFYHVEPTEVRYQNKGSFKEAFTKHETSGRYQPETVHKWRATLKQVADYSAWTTNDFKTHRELIDDVVQTFRKMVAPNAIEFTADFQAYEETIKAMDEVNDALRDEKVTVVGVYGMPGVGKTTIVSHLALQACRNGTFSRWIMANVSQNHNIDNTKRIQGILSGFLGFKLNESEVIVRAAKLHEEIMRREKLLIILDDVWDYVDLSEIGIPNSKDLQDCNSKMLLTTRIGHVCHTMECHKITLNRLSDQDSWRLFKRKARRSFDPTFEVVAKKVAEECGGLPIALVTVARALGDKLLIEWKRAAQRLENSQHANPNDDGKRSESIRLSYDYLKDEYKPFFLLCCLFPEDHEIKIEELFRYAMGKQLFRDVDTLEQARMDAKILAGHLQDSCLLLGRNGEDMKMHDVVRDTAIHISGFFVKAGRGLKHWPGRISEDCIAISLMKNKIRKLPENWVCPLNLQILLLDGNDDIKEIPETLFQSPNELRVLDFSRMSHLSSLPQSFSLLTNLQYLGIDYCWKRKINLSILGELLQLQILSIRSVRLEHLSIELDGLINLRIFDNTGGMIRRISPGVISKWKKIEELHIKGFGEWGSRVEGEGEEFINASFDEVTSLSKLTVLSATIYNAERLPRHVEISPKWDEFYVSVGFKFNELSTIEMYEHKNTRLVELRVYSISCLPEWFCDKVMEIANELHCRVHRSLFDILDHEHRGLQRLKYLHMQWCGMSKGAGNDNNEWVGWGDMYEELDYDSHESTVGSGDMSEEIEHYTLESTVGSGDMSEEIEHYTLESTVGSGDMSEEIEHNTLESTESCEEFVDDIQEIHQSNMEVDPNTVPKEPVLVNLKEWVIHELDWRLSIGAVQTLAPGSLLNLQVLKLHELRSCEIVLLPSTTLQRLPNLEELSVQHTLCRSLFGKVDESLVSLPLKLHTIDLWYSGIISICEGPVPPTMFQNLISLNIDGCSNLEGSLFTFEVVGEDAQTAQCLSRLESFSLTFCPLVEKIVQASNNEKTVLPKLKQLRLCHLEALCYESATFDIECPSLEHIDSSWCPNFAVSSEDFCSKKQVIVEGSFWGRPGSVYEDCL